MLGSAPYKASAPRGASLTSFIHFATRACSGHAYQFTSTQRLCAGLQESKMLHVSALVHVTQRGNLLGIVRTGLRPGVDRILGLGMGGRPHVYFATCLPEDPRFSTGKRESFGYDVAIVDDIDMAKEVKLFMTASACVLAEEAIATGTSN